MAHDRQLARATTGRYAAKPRPALQDNVPCARCRNPERTRADFHPKDITKRPYSWCKPCGVKMAQDWREKNRSQASLLGKRGNLKANYGITVEQYDAMHAAQRGVCAICASPGTRALAVDHCHSTGKLRGLLCDSCNNGLGRFRDDPDLLRKAAEYLTLDKNDGHKGA